MEVAGKSKAHVVIDSCMHETMVYFSDHHKLLRCNPFCSMVDYDATHDLYKWVFEVADPRENPIVAIFYVRQHEETISLSEGVGAEFAATRLKERQHFSGEGKRIRWEAVENHPVVDTSRPNTYVGRASSDIFLLYRHDKKTSVFFDTEVAVDFSISFPLNLMPEGILKFMSDTIMSQIMQQATDRMLCQVQSEICCPVDPGAPKGDG